MTDQFSTLRAIPSEFRAVHSQCKFLYSLEALPLDLKGTFLMHFNTGQGYSPLSPFLPAKKLEFMWVPPLQKQARVRSVKMQCQELNPTGKGRQDENDLGWDWMHLRGCTLPSSVGYGMRAGRQGGRVNNFAPPDLFVVIPLSSLVSATSNAGKDIPVPHASNSCPKERSIQKKKKI